MKRSWIGLGILLVLLAAGLLVSWGMGRLHDPIARELEQAASHALNDDWDRAIPAAAAAKTHWDSSHHFAACFAAHTPMEEVDALFAQMEVYAAAKESTEFAAACAELSRKVEDIGEAHGLMWWNFL